MERNVSWMIGLFVLAFVPMTAGAAGTYYTGGYRSPQQNYSMNGYASRMQTNNARAGVMPNANVYIGQQYQGYTRGTNSMVQNASQPTAQNKTKRADKGLFVNAGLTHEFANWNFDMNNAGSKLHYDNIRWNVFGADAAYKFDAGATPMQIDAGIRYGMQFGDSTMVDDDISNGGYLVTEWWDDVDGDGTADSYIGSQVGNSLSIGTSNSGSMLGFHAGLGLTDFFKVGGARVTPSIGYRYLKYKLETKQDYGLTVDAGYCATMSGSDEMQCDPIVILKYGSSAQVLWNPTVDSDGFWEIGLGASGISTGGTYMFMLPGVSHSYETEWAGPYFALDLNYDINAYNAVNARMEIGLPVYTSTGDQPYRSDWLHPTSVEDKGDLGDAWHIGLGANYITAMSDTVSLSIGFTFDYYSLSGGSATTYLSSAYYLGIYNDLLNYYENEFPNMSSSAVEEWMLENDATAASIADIQSSCPGWVCKVDNEIESVYKSLGIRVGIQAKF